LRRMGRRLRLLVSVVDRDEALEALTGGADIVDVKNPVEGSLGASLPRMIRAVREAVPPGTAEVSATIGDLPDLPGTASLAALGAAACGVDYVKAGLYGVRAPERALHLLREVCRAVKEYRPSVKVVGAGYADFRAAGSLDPMELPRLAHKSGADIIMIDTKAKPGCKVFDHMAEHELRRFVDEASGLGLQAALAGSLSSEDVERVWRLGARIIGVRGAACSGDDRLGGRVRSDRVAVLRRRVEECAGERP